MGGKNTTMQGLQVWKVLPKYNLLYVKGSIPGTRGATIRIRDSEHPKHRMREPPPFPTFLPGDPGDGTEEELLCKEATELPVEPAGKKKK